MRTDITSATAAIFAANRARGSVSFDVHQVEGLTRRRHLHESGSLRVRFPSPEAEGLSAVLVNTAGGVAIATVLIAPGDESLVERIRELSTSFSGEVGVSSWNGFAMARFCAQDAARLRADIMAVLGSASVSPLPRLWLS